MPKDELEEKLGVVSERLKREASLVREALEYDPALLDLAELCKRAFGSRFTYLRCGGYEKGQNIPLGFIPARYNKPPKGKKRIAWLRSNEQQSLDEAHDESV